MRKVFFLAVVVLLLSGCATAQPTPLLTPTPEPTLAPTPAPEPTLAASTPTPTSLPTLTAPTATPTAVLGFTGGPRISFDQESVDMGKVPLSQPQDYSFRFKNVGDAPLEIADAQTEALEGC